MIGPPELREIADVKTVTGRQFASQRPRGVRDGLGAEVLRGIPYRWCKRRGPARDGDEAAVMGDQAVPGDGEVALLRLGSEKVDVRPPVFVEQEGLLAAVAPF